MFDFSLPEARQKILDGHRIVAVMTPDERLSTNYMNPLPSYRECYPLANVCLRDDCFWGLTSGTNLPHRIGAGIGQPVLFGYTNSAPVYFSALRLDMETALRQKQQSISLCTLRQYSEFRFIAVADAELVWDGEAPNDYDALANAIERGSWFRLVFEEEDGLVFSCMVDLPMYFPAISALKITTNPVYFLEFCANPKSLVDALTGSKPGLFNNPDPLALKAQITAGTFPGFFALNSDGTYLDVNGLIANKPKSWRQARLYAF